MKIAHLPDGNSIEASENAPREAICPHCGGVLLLRHRRTMRHSVVAYFWRHASNQNLNCKARKRPASNR